jgi:hypothetical protein
MKFISLGIYTLRGCPKQWAELHSVNPSIPSSWASYGVHPNVKFTGPIAMFADISIIGSRNSIVPVVDVASMCGLKTELGCAKGVPIDACLDILVIASRNLIVPDDDV